MRAATVSFLVLIGLATHLPAAIAQPTADPKQVSRQHYDKATAAYKLGDFEDALVGYEAAYRSFAAPAFLFNIAQCHLQLGRWDRAIFFFEGYLRELPQAANRPLVEDLIAEARRKQQDAEETERQRRESESLRLAEERRAAEARVMAMRLDRPAQPAASPSRPLYARWWFWAAVGGVVAGSATVYALTADGGTALPEGSLGTWDQR